MQKKNLKFKRKKQKGEAFLKVILHAKSLVQKPLVDSNCYSGLRCRNHAEANKVRRGLRVSKWFPDFENKVTKNAIAKHRFMY